MLLSIRDLMKLLFFSVMASHRKSLNAGQVLEVYKKAYREKFAWDEILSDECYQFFNLIAKAYNSPITLTMSGIIPLCASSCGPNTKVKVRPNFESPLNTYMMSVCTKRGGKSSMYSIVTDIIEAFKDSHNINMLLECYSGAGLQTHQISNSGYAFVCSHEGHTFLASVSIKQKKTR